MNKAVLFDFHNTLATCDEWLDLEIRTLPAMALQKLAERGWLGSPSAEVLEDATRLFREMRQSVRDSGVELSAVEGTRRVLAEFGFRPSDVEIEAVVAELEFALLPRVEMVPGVDVALEALREKGFSLAVVSSAGYPPFVERALEMLGLRAYFSAVITSAGEGLYKSDPEIFRRAVASLGTLPEQAVHVGDHALYDVQSARAAGLSAVWFVGHGIESAQLHHTNWDELLRAGLQADVVIESMSELVAAIVRLP
jgi:HAD superfamily hydrolase (TIGR01509 family)